MFLSLDNLFKQLLLFSLTFLLFSSNLYAKELFFLLAGQSNMVGHGNSTELAPAYRRPPRNVTFYYNGYKTPLNRFKHFGPEIGFAHIISRYFPNDEIKLVKFAVGGTSLFAWDPKWNPSKAQLTKNASAGPLFKKLLTTTRIQFDEKRSKLAGVIWMQGETDASHSMAAREYAGSLNRFITVLRRELKSPNAMFIMGSINPPVKYFPYTSMVQRAQKKAASHIRNSRLVNTDDLEKGHDHLHYNTNGQLELGKRFANAFIKSYLAQR